jgi:hypothetical protein
MSEVSGMAREKLRIGYWGLGVGGGMLRGLQQF